MPASPLLPRSVPAAQRPRDARLARRLVTPLKDTKATLPTTRDEKRVSLTFEYVTDQSMHPAWRLISNLKDAVAYFGLRQVFRRRKRPEGL